MLGTFGFRLGVRHFELLQSRQWWTTAVSLVEYSSLPVGLMMACWELLRLNINKFSATCISFLAVGLTAHAWRKHALGFSKLSLKHRFYQDMTDRFIIPYCLPCIWM